jgi:hypothetical protein
MIGATSPRSRTTKEPPPLSAQSQSHGARGQVHAGRRRPIVARRTPRGGEERDARVPRRRVVARDPSGEGRVLRRVRTRFRRAEQCARRGADRLGACAWRIDHREKDLVVAMSRERAQRVDCSFLDVVVRVARELSQTGRVREDTGRPCGIHPQLPLTVLRQGGKPTPRVRRIDAGQRHDRVRRRLPGHTAARVLRRVGRHERDPLIEDLAN